MDHIAVLNRLKEASGAKTGAALANALGVSHQAVYNAKKNRAVPPGWIINIAREYGVSIDWLTYGGGGVGGGVKAKSPAAVVKLSEAGDFYKVPLYREARLSAGHGNFDTEAADIDYYAFRRDHLEKLGQPQKMALMTVDGDSMSPVFEDGDRVLIDESQKDLRPGKVYAVNIEGLAYLKLVNAVPGKIILESYNSDYPAQEYPTTGDMADTIRVIGRAVWVGRDL